MVRVITDMNDIYFLFSFKKMEYPYSSVDELFGPNGTVWSGRFYLFCRMCSLGCDMGCI